MYQNETENNTESIRLQSVSKSSERMLKIALDFCHNILSKQIDSFNLYGVQYTGKDLPY